MEIKKIQYLVGTQMRDFPKFRLHKNREALWLKIQAEHGKVSYSSIERAQRKLWEKGLYHPNNETDLEEWTRIRRKRTKEMRAYATT